MQLWRAPGLPAGTVVYDYCLWELDDSGLPTGRAYVSASAWEKLTTKG